MDIGPDELVDKKIDDFFDKLDCLLNAGGAITLGKNIQGLVSELDEDAEELPELIELNEGAWVAGPYGAVAVGVYDAYKLYKLGSAFYDLAESVNDFTSGEAGKKCNCGGEK